MRPLMSIILSKFVENFSRLVSFSPIDPMFCFSLDNHTEVEELAGLPSGGNEVLLREVHQLGANGYLQFVMDESKKRVVTIPSVAKTFFQEMVISVQHPLLCDHGAIGLQT